MMVTGTLPSVEVKVLNVGMHLEGNANVLLAVWVWAVKECGIRVTPLVFLV